MKGRFAVLLIGCAMLLSGCGGVLLIGAGVGAGAFSYIAGNLTRVYEADYKTSIEASATVMEQLNFLGKEESEEGLKTIFEGSLDYDTPVTIEVVFVDEGSTQIGVRTGYIGNDNLERSERLHAEIAKELEKLAPPTLQALSAKQKSSEPRTLRATARKKKIEPPEPGSRVSRTLYESLPPPPARQSPPTDILFDPSPVLVDEWPDVPAAPPPEDELELMEQPQPGPDIVDLTQPQPEPELEEKSEPQPGPEVEELSEPQPEPEVVERSEPQPGPEVEERSEPQTEPEAAEQSRPQPEPAIVEQPGPQPAAMDQSQALVEEQEEEGGFPLPEPEPEIIQTASLPEEPDPMDRAPAPADIELSLPVSDAPEAVEPEEAQEQVALLEPEQADKRFVYLPQSEQTIHLGPYAVLDEVIAYLDQNPSADVDIRAYIPPSDDSDRHLALAQKRVFEIRNYMILNGISADRISARGLGEDSFLKSGGADRGQQQHPVEMIIR